MTEKAGGSDVGDATHTEARWNEEKQCYELSGYKWFTSAITSDMTLTLARNGYLMSLILLKGPRFQYNSNPDKNN